MTPLLYHFNLLQRLLRRGLFYLGIVLAQLPLATQSAADEILVAVASNFIEPMTEIAERFSDETGHQVNLASGASGRFVAQIRNGAPFQIFLSADQERVSALIGSGHALAASRFTYATGALVLWSANEQLAITGLDALTDLNYRRLALANPALAPYGRAAEEVLTNRLLLDATRSRWVQGENISQTFQFVSTGNAELGFVAASQVMDSAEIRQGSGWLIPQSYHSPILQDAVLLSSAEDCAACRELLDFLRSEASQRIITAAGYRQN